MKMTVVIMLALIFITILLVSLPHVFADEPVVGTFTPNPLGPIIVCEHPDNQSTVDMYPLLSLEVNETNGDAFNITWTTNATSWTDYNATCVNGTYTQLAYWANESNTTYWWTARINNTVGNWSNTTYHFTTGTYDWGNWSHWWIFNYSIAELPSNFTATAYNTTQINLTWIEGTLGVDATVLVRNNTGSADYPSTPTSGLLLFNGSGTNYSDIGLATGIQYFYSLWSWNGTKGNFSLLKAIATNTTISTISFSGPYPPNTSTEIERPPVNLSVYISGTNVDIYVYFCNMTPVSDTWNLVSNWSGVTNERIEYTILGTYGRETEFIWGNTTYTWSVNATVTGLEWVNQTYTYTTNATASGGDARYDVDNNNATNVGDLSSAWGHRTFDGTATYDNLFDVTAIDGVNKVTVHDLGAIWGHRT